MRLIKRPTLLFVLFFNLLFTDFSISESNCPDGCDCETPKLKLKCTGPQWIELAAINFTIFSPYENLDLSNNKVTALSAFFLHAPTLKKLNLSENKIKVIDANAFTYVPNLNVLDLSNNQLYNVSSELFAPLKNLERLKLRSNFLKSLSTNTFDNLLYLKNLDLSENPWHCDCTLFLFSRWVKSKAVKLQPLPKCITPEKQANVPLKRIELNCVNLPELELEPSNDQIVFEGDSLSLRCRSIGSTYQVKWIWSEQNPKVIFPEVEVEERTPSDNGLAESLVRIKLLKPVHSGNWVCSQVSGGNNSAAVSVVVLSEKSKYCPNEITKNNKGAYFWPRSVIDHQVEIPCAEERSGVHSSVASYYCNVNGNWEALNTSSCPYISKTTKILEQFARDNLTVAKDTIVAKAKHLLNVTNYAAILDFMDVVFLSRSIKIYAEHTKSNNGLASLLVDIISSSLRLPQELFINAEKYEKSCSTIRNTMNFLAEVTPIFQEHKSSVAIEAFSVNPEKFKGIACAWRLFENSRQFQCSTNERVVREAIVRDVTAMAQMPASLFSGMQLTNGQLIVSMFENASLFPDLSSELDNMFMSAVVGVHSVDLNEMNLTDPITVMIKTETLAEPMRWDETLNSGSGGWTNEGCRTYQSTLDVHLFHCHRLGYYSLRQSRLHYVKSPSSVIGLATFYSGSFALLICLLASISTFFICHGAVQMSRRAKHAVANTWLSIFMLCFLYSFGIYATDDVKMCEIIGLSLHYFSLTTLLWMAVAGNHMYKRLSRGSFDRSPDELPPGVPLQKPILGLYLVGWGVGLIVCGISGAVHLRDYAQPSFCFLGAGPALSAVLVPTAILITVLATFYFLSLCVIRNNDVNGQLSEGTQGTENVDLELLEDGPPPDQNSMPSDLTDSEDVEDPEHSPLLQVKAHIIVLVLFILLWISAALAATGPVHAIMSYQEPIANALYCLLAFSLGAFILYFYCVARSDIRAQWSTWCRLFGKNQRCCRTRSVSDANASMPLQVATANPIITNRPPSVNSGLTGRSSSSHRTKAILELNNCDSSGSGVVMHCKPSNTVNLVAMHRQMYRSNNSMPTYQEISNQNCADAFYNPRQSIVAKKFFKKQRRNRRNDLGVRRRGDGGGTSEGEISQPRRTWRPSAESAVFLSSDMENNSDKIGPNLFHFSTSKINNTNIHVGNSSHKKEGSSSKDPNVLSDEGDDKGGKKVLLARLVIGAEEDEVDLNRAMASSSSGLDRVDEESLGQPPDCRSVELQCSLGSSSDVPDGDEPFCQKIDNMQLALDESNEERLLTPPQYVTVLDPKYGVVKVTMNDYHQESHRLSLASSPSAANSIDEQRSSLPSMDEDCGTAHSSNFASLCNLECIESRDQLAPMPNNLQIFDSLITHDSPTSHSLGNNVRKTPPQTLNLTGKAFQKPLITYRRSLPSSPENRDVSNAHRRSLPSSPETNERQSSRRGIPRLTLPPPPPLDSISLPDIAADASLDLSDVHDHEQWQRPEAPTSPSIDRTRRPLSEDLIDNRQRKQFRASLNNSPETPTEEVKKETSV